MFGLRNKPDQQNAQIPYEVYETIQQPSARRRAWFIRLIIALIVVTLLIVGGLYLKRTFIDDNDASTGNNGQSQSGTPTEGNGGQSANQAQPPQTLVQSPQQNTPTANPGADSGTPATLPQSSGQNNTTVRKPE